MREGRGRALRCRAAARGRGRATCLMTGDCRGQGVAFRDPGNSAASSDTKNNSLEPAERVDGEILPPKELASWSVDGTRRQAPTLS